MTENDRCSPSTESHYLPGLIGVSERIVFGKIAPVAKNSAIASGTLRIQRAYKQASTT